MAFLKEMNVKQIMLALMIIIPTAIIGIEYADYRPNQASNNNSAATSQ